MLELTRTIRFSLADGKPPSRPARSNSWSAWPPIRGLAYFFQLQVTCRGEADPATGYFINIREIDDAVRAHVIPYFESLLTAEVRPASTPMGHVLHRALELLQPPLHSTVVRVRLELSPFHSLEAEAGNMNQIVIRQEYEFSAAHRLHVPSLSDDENRALFGKCNNPNGHGHNSRVQVAVRAAIHADGQLLPIEALDDLVDRVVIRELDHKHLSYDVPRFTNVNTTVENIAKAVHEMLVEPVKTLGVELDEISVWETPKTVCTYRGS